VASTFLYYNPSCSKCRTAWSILEEEGVEAQQLRYLDAPPTKDELRSLMAMLGIDSPIDMMRSSDMLFKELSLDAADSDVLLDAIVQHPKLLERPIFVLNGKAVIARPPERVRELLQK
jgi:arsenate reductase